MLHNYVKIENSIEELNGCFQNGQVIDKESAEAALSSLYFHLGELYGSIKGDTEKYAVYFGPSYIDVSKDGKHCKISALAKADDGSIVAPVRFSPPDYAAEKYGFSPFIVYFHVGAEIPYYAAEFAYKIGDEYKSLLVRDENIPWDASMAKKMLGDGDCSVTERGTHFERDGKLVTGTVFSLPYKNEKCSIFRPTVIAPVSGAMNVDTELAVEILLTFDDGYMVPIIKHTSTSGPFSISVPDIMEDVLSAFRGSLNEIKEFLSSSGNYAETEDGFTLLCATKDGQNTNAEFYDGDIAIDDLKRSITSIRLIELNETIHDRKGN